MGWPIKKDVVVLQVVRPAEKLPVHAGGGQAQTVETAFEQSLRDDGQMRFHGNLKFPELQDLLGR